MKLSKDKIALQRAKKCMTVEGLAKEYGVSRQRMFIILNQREVTPMCVWRMAAALGVEPEEIIE